MFDSHLNFNISIWYYHFQICGNVENIFGKFVRDGKATIRFKQPTHELYLSKVSCFNILKDG